MDEKSFEKGMLLFMKGTSPQCMIKVSTLKVKLNWIAKGSEEGVLWLY